MNSPQAFVGIDVSKGGIHAHVIPTAKSLRLKVEDDPGFSGLLNLLRETQALGYTIERVVVEATGGYEIPVVAALCENAFPVVVMNPRQVKDFAKAAGRLAKTDRVDARMIARFAEKIRPEIRPLPSAGERELREIVIRRRQLIDTITAETNRLEAITSALVRESIERTVKQLEEEVNRIEEDVRKLTAADSPWGERMELLMTAKGVGEVTALALVAYLPELGQLSRKQIASLAGLAPWSNDSGGRSGKRSIWGGRAALRSALHMATLSAVKYNPQLRVMYERLLQNGKVRMVAMTVMPQKTPHDP